MTERSVAVRFEVLRRRLRDGLLSVRAAHRRAEIVGNVGEVLVAVGDHLGAEDPVVLLESMKMEIPVLAEVAGTVVALAVTTGDLVQEGDVIAEIEPDAAPRP
jgi:acetyl-CoA carboxylase biotin carboxyl carrier protein